MQDVKFQPHTIYHLYNQGNNQEQIFFSHDNYLFFLQKMRNHLLPHVHFLAYCLMPNDFHWLIVTKPSACERSSAVKPMAKGRDKADPADHLQQNLSHAIAIVLRSYARAINKQENRTGSLFRQKTKVKNAWIKDISTTENTLFFRPDNDYAQQCLCDIHDSPLKVGLVLKPEDWLYSSARDYAELRKGSLCNKELAKALLWQWV